MSSLLNYLLSTDPHFRKARLAALYSDFNPLLTLNPDGYNANILAWRHGLASAALSGHISSPNATADKLSLTVNSALLRDLNTEQWGMPLALGTVAREALESREWVLHGEFMGSRESVYSRKGWRVPGVGEVVGWGLRRLGLVGGNEDSLLESGKLSWRVVVLENLEVVGKGAIERFEQGRYGRVERIFSNAAFRKTFEDVLGKERVLSEGDLQVLVKFLERDKGVLVSDGETIKFKAPGEKGPTTITIEDTTIASLKELIKDLESQTTVLTKNVDELTHTAKEAVSRKNKVSALAALRSKKLAESTLTKRHATLAQLEDVFAKIEQAADQVELVKIMESSAAVLSGFNKEVGGVDRVDEVVEQLREQMSQVDEVGNVIAEPGREAGGVDEMEVDEELEAMEKVENEKREAKERAEREEKDSKEAEETRKRLDALEEVERVAKENARKDAEAEASSQVYDGLDLLKKLSLEPTKEDVPA